jgi:hypothetical protein
MVSGSSSSRSEEELWDSRRFLKAPTIWIGCMSSFAVI